MMWPITAMCASVARAGAVRVRIASGRPSQAARSVGESVEMSRDGGLEDAGELGLDDQQPPVGDAGVVGRWGRGRPRSAPRLSESPVSVLRGEGRDRRPRGGGRRGPRRSPCGLWRCRRRGRGTRWGDGGWLRLRSQAWRPSGGAERDQQLGEDGDRVGFGVRRDRVDDPAGEAVEGGRLRAGRQAVGRRQQLVAGVVGSVEER